MPPVSPCCYTAALMLWQSAATLKNDAFPVGNADALLLTTLAARERGSACWQAFRQHLPSLTRDAGGRMVVLLNRLGAMAPK